MKNLLITFLIVFSCHLVFSQNNVKTYYQLVNKAELEICNNSYSKAFAIYEKAFTNLEHPFYTDVKNAFVCGYYAHKPEKKLKKYAAILTNKSNGFKDLIDSADRDDRYYRIKEFAEKTEITLDQYLVTQVDNLLKEDKRIRKKCVAYKTECVGEVRVVDSINRMNLISLFNRYGSINEENAGSKSSFMIFILSIHNQMWCLEPFEKYIFHQLLIGEFDAKQYSIIEDRRRDESHCIYIKDDYGNRHFQIWDSVLFIDGIDNKTKGLIDSARMNIFLDSMDNLITKTIYVLNHPEFKMGAEHNFFLFDPIEDRAYAQSMMNKIDNNEITNAIYFDLRKLK